MKLISICALLLTSSLSGYLSAETIAPQNTNAIKPVTPAPPSPFQQNPSQVSPSPAVPMPQVGLPNTAFNYGQYGNYKGLPDYLKNHPAVLLKNAVERVSQFVSRGGAQDVQTLDRFLDEQIAPFFDFSRMASLVGGRLYQKMDEPNRKEFQQRLQLLMFDTLTSYVVSFDGSTPRTAFYPPINNGNNQMIARLRVLRQNMPPTNLAFRFTKGNNGWKVVDVAANGQSAILYYRQYYRSYTQEIMMRERMQQSMQDKTKPTDTISPDVPAIPEPQAPNAVTTDKAMEKPAKSVATVEEVKATVPDQEKPAINSVDSSAMPSAEAVEKETEKSEVSSEKTQPIDPVQAKPDTGSDSSAPSTL